MDIKEVWLKSGIVIASLSMEYCFFAKIFYYQFFIDYISISGENNDMMCSFIITCYNSGKTIEKCLDSIVNQTNSDFECIVYNDGSTDNTEEIIKTYSDKDSRVKCFYHSNSGTSITTNECIEKAQGKYIIPVDHDDWIENNLLELLKKVIDKDDCDIISFNCDSFPINKYENNNDGKIIVSRDNIDKLDIAFNKSNIHLTHTSTCIKKELFSDGVVFDGDGYGADTVVMQQLIHKAKKICQINTVLYHRLYDENSVSRRKQRQEINLSIAERSLKYLKPFKEDNAEHAYELRKVFDWYVEGRGTLLRKKPYKIFRIMKCGWKIYFNRRIVMQKPYMTLRNYILLLFPFIPIKAHY